MKSIIFLLSICLSYSSYSQVKLLDNEERVLEFETLRGKQLLIALDTNHNYLVYRYGSKENVELEFPDQLSSSWQSFQYSFFMRGGGLQNEGIDLNYLYFERGDYRYVVFEEYSARTQEYEYGIMVIDRESGKTSIIKAQASSSKGSLISLRDLKEIKIGDELFR